MDNIIQELIKIEDYAVFLTKEAEQEKKFLSQEIQKRKKEIYSRIEWETKEKIKKIHDSAIFQSQEKIFKLKNDMQLKLAQFENDYSKNKDKWADEIFQRIISLE